MKRIVLFIVLMFACMNIYARVTIMCDVVYEESVGKWSEFRRTNVEFLSGKEKGDILNQTKLYAIIWYSQGECSVIKIDYDSPILSDVDVSFIYYFLTFDILNEGRSGTQINDNGKNRKWRIYGKDDNSFLIDPIFSRGDYRTYNDRVQKNKRNGQIVKRQRPKEELKSTGLIKGIVKYVSHKEWYIVQTDDYYVGVTRNKLYVFYGSIDVDDIVFADFHTKGKTSISNHTQNTTRHYVIVEELFKNYTDCFNYMKKKYGE